jgi:SAM-dependent methyltransferase
MAIDPASLERFSGFPDLYDANRPSPPAGLGPLLASYANVRRPVVVDLGSGTGLSSRWAATWASSVIGIEPNDEMRSVAASHGTAGIEYRRGVAHETGLAESSTDVVIIVQAMHWMEPEPTLAEVARVLRPGGVLAVIDADWPPVAGIAQVEEAWALMHGRIRVFEARLARGESGELLRRPIEDSDPDRSGDDLVDPHRDRLLADGLRSWSKTDHLTRIASSGHFSYTRELVMSGPVDGGAERFKALMYSQGSYQRLRKADLTDAEIGADDFDREVTDGFAQAVAFPGLQFSWRARIGINQRES